MWLLPIETDIVGCLPYIHLPFLLANRKLLWSGGILPSLGHESWPIRISPTYPVAQDWCKDGFGSTSGWQNVKTHLLGDCRKYFISEKRRHKQRKLFCHPFSLLGELPRGDMILNRDNCFASVRGNITAILAVTECALIICALDTGKLPVNNPGATPPTHLLLSISPYPMV